MDNEKLNEVNKDVEGKSFPPFKGMEFKSMGGQTDTGFVHQEPYSVNTQKEKKTKKASKFATKYILIPLVLLIIALFYFTVRAGSMTYLLNKIVSIFTGGGSAITADYEDYSVDPIIRGDKDGVTQGGITLTLDEEEQNRLDELADKSRVSLIISSSPYFSSVTEKGAFFISNPADSFYSQQVVIVTKDTDEEMYVSPILDPNEKIEYDYLTNQHYEPGRYGAYALFHYYTREGVDNEEPSYTYIGTMMAEITVVIDK